ncbi:hypothetical protein [Dactylosporangium sp. NPDC049140]|uniref:hypothetical protein n=1 Tax=Dactylosporangium sp. NPDC049140 TaxID=3155647 RepID=UPI0033DBE7E4
MRRLWLALVLGWLSGFAPLTIDMYLPALPGMARDLHTSAPVVQLSLTVFVVGLALGQVVAGPGSAVAMGVTMCTCAAAALAALRLLR